MDLTDYIVSPGLTRNGGYRRRVHVGGRKCKEGCTRQMRRRVCESICGQREGARWTPSIEQEGTDPAEIVNDAYSDTSAERTSR